MKAIGLIRVSTVSQDLKQQADEVVKEMHKDGYKDKDIILIQDKESGIKLSEEERLGLNHLKEHIIMDSSIKCVYVYELSRLSRRPNVLYSIRDFLIDHNIQLVVLRPYMKLLDTDGKISQTASIMFGIFGAMAEQEIYLLKERSKRGRQKRINEGKFDGGGILYGYTVDKDGYLRINKEEAKVVRRIYDMSSKEDKSGYVIGRILFQENVFPGISTAHNATLTVNKILCNPSYIGKGRLQYPPIITEEQFNECRELAKKRNCGMKTSSKNVYLCRNLLYDSVSGNVLSPIKKDNAYIFGRTTYKTVTLSMSKMDKWVWDYTLPRYTDRQDYGELMKRNNLSRKKLETELDKIKVKLDKLVSLYLNDNVSKEIYDERMKEILKSKSSIELKYKQLEEESFQLQIQYRFSEIGIPITDYTLEQKCVIVKSVIRKVMVTTTAPRRHHIEVHLMDGSLDSFDLLF